MLEEVKKEKSEEKELKEKIKEVGILNEEDILNAEENIEKENKDKEEEQKLKEEKKINGEEILNDIEKQKDNEEIKEEKRITEENKEKENKEEKNDILLEEDNLKDENNKEEKNDIIIDEKKLKGENNKEEKNDILLEEDKLKKENNKEEKNDIIIDEKKLKDGNSKEEESEMINSFDEKLLRDKLIYDEKESKIKGLIIKNNIINEEVQENMIKEKINNQLKEEEILEKQKEEEIQKLLKEEELLEKDKREEVNKILDEEEIMKKRIEEKINQQLLDEEILYKKIEEKNNKNKEEEVVINNIEEEKNKKAEEDLEKIRVEEENKKKEEEEKKIREEVKRIEEENQRKIEEENKRKIEEENKRKEEENKKVEQEKQKKLEDEKKKIKEENIRKEEEEEEKKKKEKEIIEKEKREKEYKDSHYIQSLKKDPKIGLNNIGATCYMNATLQCLSHTTNLTNYFLNPINESKFTPEKKLSYSYFNLIKNLWQKHNEKQKSFSPNDFKNIISEMNPLFQGIAANDSKDLILFILEQIHRELKPEENGDNGLAQNYEEIDQSDKNAVLEDFDKSMKNNVSIISELFFGKNEIISDCLNCRQNGNPIVKYNFQIFNFIVFPLKEVSNYKKNKFSILNNINNINNIDTGEESVTLDECFEQYVLPAIMTGDNMMFCNNCQQLSATSYTTKIYTSPEILILILNRGKGNEFKIKINFEQIISIDKYVEQKESSELKYKLYGVLTHLGSSDMNGHFVAFCYSIIDNVWYKFNDGLVDQVNNFQKEVHDFGEPYVLFYEKMK